MGFTADEWLAVLRARVRPVAKGALLELPFLMIMEPQRNHDTVLFAFSAASREPIDASTRLPAYWNLRTLRPA